MTSEKEHELLRNEIVVTYNHIHTDYTILYAAVCTILGFALKADVNANFVVCLLLQWLIIVPWYLTVEAKEDGIANLGAYIYVFHEEKEFNWERRHHCFDKKYVKCNWKGAILFYSLAALCGLEACYKCFEFYTESYKIQGVNGIIHRLIYAINDCNNFIVVLVQSFVMIISTLIVFYVITKCRTNYTDSRERYIYKWEKIKKEEQQKMESEAMQENIAS